MQPFVLDKLDKLKSYVGTEVVTTDWLLVTQERIQHFAEVTEDWQWIHVDRERARRESPYDTTIAHGFLTLSLLSKLMMQSIKIQRARMAINYGLNRVRFPSTLPADSKIRARFALQALKEVSGGFEAVWSVVVEHKGADKPCCAAEWVVRYYY